jgi:hypothetical protein
MIDEEGRNMAQKKSAKNGVAAKAKRKSASKRTGRSRNAAVSARPSKLRGLLPTPPEIAEVVAQIERERPMSDMARVRITGQLTLQHYFGGEEVAYRLTEHGMEVWAVGIREIGRLFRETPPSKRPGVTIGYPEPW